MADGDACAPPRPFFIFSVAEARCYIGGTLKVGAVFARLKSTPRRQIAPGRRSGWTLLARSRW